MSVVTSHLENEPSLLKRAVSYLGILKPIYSTLALLEEYNYPPVSKASREVANLAERNIRHDVKEFVCMYFCLKNC